MTNFNGGEALKMETQGFMAEVILKDDELYSFMSDEKSRSAFEFSNGPFRIQGDYVEAGSPRDAAEQVIGARMTSGTLPRPLEVGDMAVVIWGFEDAGPSGRLYRIEMTSPLLLSNGELDFDKMFTSDVDPDGDGEQ